jgi:membrane protease YdiL (CAAX protease family)
VSGVAVWLRAGGVATLGVATLFGLLHRDMPGGLGIVRFVAATGLGLACGVSRQASGTVLAPVLLHVAFNALSIATARRWVVTADFPMKWGAPTAVSGLAVLGIAGFLVRGVLGSRRQSGRDVGDFG